MSDEPPFGIELRFLPCTDPAAVRAIMAALLRWEPALAPASVDRLSDLDAEGPEPWREELWTVLADRCARAEGLGWSLFSGDGRNALNVGCDREELSISITVPRAQEDVDRFRALIVELPDDFPLALALAFDRDSPDDELIGQKLGTLGTLPSLLYLDHRFEDRVGGLERVQNAAAATEELEHGALFRIR